MFRYSHLHSTMFLLIPAAEKQLFSGSTFTFHNVSINTAQPVQQPQQNNKFTFHNVSINTHPSQSLILQA